MNSLHPSLWSAASHDLGQLKTQQSQIADLHQSLAAQKDTIDELKALVKQSIATPAKTATTEESYEVPSSHASRSMRAAFNLSPDGKDDAPHDSTKPPPAVESAAQSCDYAHTCDPCNASTDEAE